ncbi:MAG: metallophosphoesterase family protein [Clostridia bacterium]|nr:metallophosphoesterase family protein [Clostridia bacterium]MBR5410412.1 metallophosphoesterase family protein [Clostridia bacterium]
MKRTLLRAIALALVLLLAFSSVGFAYEKDEVKRVSCSVYGDGATGRGFCWFTEGKTNADLDLIESARFTGSFDGAKAYAGETTRYRSQYSHQVAVTDLQPGTAYTYRVGDRAAGVWSEACTFVTDDRDDTLSFITIADVQAGSLEDFTHAAETLAGAVETLPGAEFIVNLGDYVNDNTNDEWDWYFEAFKAYNDAYTGVPVAGNHDGNITNKLNTFCFRNTFCLDKTDNRSLEGVYYSFDWGNAHFAVLNTNDMYPMSQAQKNWLRNDMNASAATWKILLMHRSLYSAGKNINKPDTIVMRDVLLPIIDELKIDVVLSGHDHMYLRTDFLKDDARVGVSYVTEAFGGEETTFAVDPDGTVYALPSTAGTKRYAVNEDAIAPILEVAEVAETTRDRGGCFATVEIEGGRLVYKAYLVDDDTREITEIDRFAIKKTASGTPGGRTRDQSFFSSVYSSGVNFIVAIVKMLVSYLKLLAQVVAK